MRKKVFITGSTGYIGEALTKVLLEDFTVHAICRNCKEASDEFQNINYVPFEGTLEDKPVIYQAMEGCDYVFHLAGFAEPWHPDKDYFYRINVLGSKNIFEAAYTLGVKRVIYTSTAGVFGPSLSGELINENHRVWTNYSTKYEKSKAEAEEVAMEYFHKGLPIIILNPTRVFGPGKFSKSNAGTLLIKKYTEGSWRFLLGDGSKYGNYVFVEDVVQGHLLAMENGKLGQRYILGGDNVTYKEFFNILSEESGKKFRMFSIPSMPLLAFAELQLLFAQVFRIKPMITPGFMVKYLQNWKMTSENAINELGYSPTPFRIAIQKTLKWLRKEKNFDRGRYTYEKHQKVK
ncbi:MAG: NAD-dependent epimerase/dehydratase family protein [Cyclobacteriaceae bacterium]|nr:NAD-dependent epimerase/dehydratase family protein [Cyclobacteriaceae bacterium]